MLMFLATLACDQRILTTTGELGRLDYALRTSYTIEGVRLDEAQLAIGYPQYIEVSLTLAGWKLVKTEPYLVYHTSPDPVTLEVETLLDGAIGVPSFTIQADQEGTFLVESKKKDTLIDKIHLNFVKPDAISVLSWIREPSSTEFALFSGENISVKIGSQAAFVPVPMFEGNRIVGDVDVEITVEPPEAAVVGYNIESISEDGVESNTSPASLYFMQAGTVLVGATDLVNNVTTYQSFTVLEN